MLGGITPKSVGLLAFSVVAADGGGNSPLVEGGASPAHRPCRGATRAHHRRAGIANSTDMRVNNLHVTPFSILGVQMGGFTLFLTVVTPFPTRGTIYRQYLYHVYTRKEPAI